MRGMSRYEWCKSRHISVAPLILGFLLQLLLWYLAAHTGQLKTSPFIDLFLSQSFLIPLNLFTHPDISINLEVQGYWQPKEQIDHWESEPITKCCPFMSPGVDNFGLHYIWLLRGPQQNWISVAQGHGELNETRDTSDWHSPFLVQLVPALHSYSLEWVIKINYMHQNTISGSGLGGNLG